MLVEFRCLVHAFSNQGSYGVLKSMKNIWSFSSLEKYGKKLLGLLVSKKEIVFQV